MFGLTGIIAGIILIILGGVMVFLFPSAGQYQPEEFSIIVIVIGFVMIILGAVLVFV